MAKTLKAMARLTKTIYQPIGNARSGNAVGNSLMLDVPIQFAIGDFVSILSGSICQVDRIVSVDQDGVITVSGTYSGPITLQRLANLSGFWLSLTVTPDPPISIGIVCGGPKGMLLDRVFPECALGRELTIGGISLGRILGAAELADGRSIISVEKPQAISGVGVAVMGHKRIYRGKVGKNSPFVSFSENILEPGRFEFSLNHGWRSRKHCIGDVIDYHRILCEGDFNG